MEIFEILDKIENLIKSEDLKSTESKTETEDQPNENPAKSVFSLVLSFVLNILKAPFRIIAKYLKKEIIATIKKDARLLAFILGIMGVLLVFFAVLWLFIAIAVGVFFQEQGHSILMSIVYSIIFQVFSFIVLGFIAFVFSKKIKSFKMLKKLSEDKDMKKLKRN